MSEVVPCEGSGLLSWWIDPKRCRICGCTVERDYGGGTPYHFRSKMSDEKESEIIARFCPDKLEPNDEWL